MARNSLLCADVPLRNYSLTHFSTCEAVRWQIGLMNVCMGGAGGHNFSGTTKGMHEFLTLLAKNMWWEVKKLIVLLQSGTHCRINVDPLSFSALSSVL